MSDTHYYVFPETPNYQTIVVSESEKAELLKPSLGFFGKLGMSAWVFVLLLVIVSIISFVIAFALFGEGKIKSLGAFLAVFCLPAIIIPLSISSLLYLILEKIGTSEKSKKEATLAVRETRLNKEAREKEIFRVTNEAKSLTAALTEIHNMSLKTSSVLPECLEDAVYYLDEAEKEYRANAFASYWDAIEEAAKWLGLFNDGARELAEDADEYYRKLNGKNHTFPAFPVRFQALPDSSLVVERFNNIVRLGQTNFHFASIWEQRKTRAIMIAGFRTLHEAIYNLGHTIENSVSDLRESMSSEMAVLVQEQIKTRESIVKEQIKTREAIDQTRHSIDKTGESIDKKISEQNQLIDTIQKEA